MGPGSAPRSPPLPPLREELQISQGAPLLSGAPTWVIYDPIRHKFFQIGQRTIEILSRWSVGTAQGLRERLMAERAIRVGDDELERLIAFLRQNSLIAPGTAGSSSLLYRQEQRMRALTPLRALQKVVFFRVPLVRPQAFLEATYPAARLLMSRSFVWFTALVLPLALYLASRQYADLLDYGRASFSLSGLVTYAIAIAVLKMLHELGHAYHAVARGLRVPVMGVAFMAMFPLLYTDVTDSWRLRDRRGKMMIDAAGVMTEMTVAVYALLLWCFLPDGTMRALAFAAATSGWILSLFVNLNPLMRFDGYYLLADTLGIQNLQTRSFAMGKWALRRGLFGLDLPAPERLSNNMARFMVTYAYAVWIYRFFLFLSIALLLYVFFFKALGVVFLFGALVAFIGKPVLAELGVWYQMLGAIVKSPRSWLSLGVLLAALVAFFWPFSTRIGVPAVLEYERQVMIFPPEGARLEALLVSEGMTVEKGDVLMRFSNPELPLQLAQSRTRLTMYDNRLLSGAGDSAERGERVTLLRLRDQERETLAALEDREAELVVRAAGAGIVMELEPEIRPGVWTDRRTLLGRIVQPGDFVLRGLIQEADRERLDRSSSGRFIAENVLLPSVELASFEISDYAVERLPDGYFASTLGGEIAVEPNSSNALVPRGVWYPLTGKVNSEALDGARHVVVANRGRVVLKSRPEAFATRLWRRIVGVLIRESGL